MPSDDARAEELLGAMGLLVEGESLDDAVSALLTLLWRICEHAEIDPADVADTFLQGTYRVQVARGLASEVGET